MKKLLLFIISFLFLSVVLSAQGTTVINSSSKDDDKNKGNKENLTPFDPRKMAFTVGVLQSGSLIGVELEGMVAPKIGLQAGMGLSSFSAGLNLHFKPTIRSSYLNIGIIQMGFGENSVATVFGPNFVFRAKKLFTCSVGWGYIVNEGRNFDNVYDENVKMLFNFSLGLYFPF